MASPSTEAPRPPTTIRDLISHGDYDDDLIADEEDEEDEWDDVSKRMYRLSVEGSDGGDADDGYHRGGDVDEVRSDVNGATYRCPWLPYDGPARDLLAVPPSASLPGTPDRGSQAAASWRWPAPSGGKEYASETEARRPPGLGGRRRERVMWLERAWRMRKQRRQLQGQAGEVPVVVLGGGGESASASRGGVAMDVEEVRACRDLGLDLPYDWTVEIPCVDTASSGGNSPASGSWRISSPGDDPKDVKARLKVWAQAVALASASRLGAS